MTEVTSRKVQNLVFLANKRNLVLHIQRRAIHCLCRQTAKVGPARAHASKSVQLTDCATSKLFNEWADSAQNKGAMFASLSKAFLPTEGAQNCQPIRWVQCGHT